MNYAHEYLLYLPVMILVLLIRLFFFDRGKDAAIFGLCIAVLFGASIYCVYYKYAYYVVFDNSPAALVRVYNEAHADMSKIKELKKHTDIEQFVSMIDNGEKPIDPIRESVNQDKIIWCLNILEDYPEVRAEVMAYIKQTKADVPASLKIALTNNKDEI